MHLASLGVDVYQLTTLVAHAELGRLDHVLAMRFFFRKLPPQRNYVVFAGLRHVVEWCRTLRFDDEDQGVLRRHPVIGPLLERRPEVLERLAAVRGFRGEIDALPEGTLAFAGGGRTTSGEPLRLGGRGVALCTPLIQARTDMTHAKLCETPWLSRINHLSMVASKAARVVSAAQGRMVVEFGQRRTHPAAAVDASYAAYLGGCASTSNLAATARFGIPSTGTMDHFAVQASERPRVPLEEAERVFFAKLVELMPESHALLVDTYDTERGLRIAAEVGGARLQAVRLDSDVTPERVRAARAILDEAGARHARILVSDALDEWRVRELAAAGADAFGVGENITCSPDAAAGVGAVGKIVVNGHGKPTMKLSAGSGKATLPGLLQVWRAADHDLLALHDEAGPPGARPLLEPVWRDGELVAELPPLETSRAHVARQIEALPPKLRALETDHAEPWPLVASDRLVDLLRRCHQEVHR